MKNKISFLYQKAKYKVVEPYYMEGTTPDGPVVFSGSSILPVNKLIYHYCTNHIYIFLIVEHLEKSNMVHFLNL